MISYKVLIILMLIFYIITCCNGVTQEDLKEHIRKSKEDLIKIIENTKDYEACNMNLTKIGLHSDGYYNLLYVLDFIKDNSQYDETFLEHVKEMLDITQINVDISSEEVDQTLSTKINQQELYDKYDIQKIIENIMKLKFMNSEYKLPTQLIKIGDATSPNSIDDQTKIEITRFIYSFYKDVSKMNFEDIEKWISPFTCCAYSLMEEKEEKKNQPCCFFGNLKKLFGVKKTHITFTADDADEADEADEEKKLYAKIQEFGNQKKNKKYIKECIESIVNIRLVIDNKEYKFDENNVFRCAVFLMYLYNIILHPDEKNHFRADEAQNNLKTMDEHQRNYFEYIKILSESKYTDYKMFSKYSLCQIYVYGKNVEDYKFPKKGEIEDGGDNHNSHNVHFSTS